MCIPGLTEGGRSLASPFFTKRAQRDERCCTVKERKKESSQFLLSALMGAPAGNGVGGSFFALRGERVRYIRLRQRQQQPAAQTQLFCSLSLVPSGVFFPFCFAADAARRKMVSKGSWSAKAELSLSSTTATTAQQFFSPFSKSSHVKQERA